MFIIYYTYQYIIIVFKYFFEQFLLIRKSLEAIVTQGTRLRVTRRLCVQSPLGGMNYYLSIFSFPRSGTKVKHGVEFCHSTRNASKNSRGSGERSVSAYSAMCGIQREADFYY